MGCVFRQQPKQPSVRQIIRYEKVRHQSHSCVLERKSTDRIGAVGQKASGDADGVLLAALIDQGPNALRHGIGVEQAIVLIEIVRRLWSTVLLQIGRRGA